MSRSIALFEHITTGGAVYWTDNDNFAEAKLIIRADGWEPELIRFKLDELEQTPEEKADAKAAVEADRAWKERDDE